MNAEIVRRWNEVVMPDDTVYHLGDVALGKIDDSLPRVGELNGYKVLILGNHDRPFMDKRKAEKRQHWLDEYSKYFDAIHEHYSFTFGASDENDVITNLSHFPYDSDSHGEDRYVDDRIPDNGSTPIVHGHTHSRGNPVSYSRRGTLQVHVGQDAWKFEPVSEFQVHQLLLRERVVV